MEFLQNNVNDIPAETPAPSTETSNDSTTEVNPEAEREEYMNSILNEFLLEFSETSDITNNSDKNNQYQFRRKAYREIEDFHTTRADVSINILDFWKKENFLF